MSIGLVAASVVFLPTKRKISEKKPSAHETPCFLTGFRLIWPTTRAFRVTRIDSMVACLNAGLTRSRESFKE